MHRYNTGVNTIKIPGYKIERLIAEGGMASVYLATHKSLGRYVALKLLRKFDNTNQSKRFLREGKILATLHHDNIITIFDVGVTESDQPYISMEYLEGGDLEARIKKGMTPDDALKVVDGIADCLSLVHNEGIIHRDIKPANILFHKNGTPILTDFGIAKQEDRTTQLTMEGSAFGSPYYLSPEQAECKTLDGRTDIYGLGIVLYEMLTGEKPYQGNSHIETIVAHMSDALPVLPQELSQYQELLNKMIAKSPADRFSDAIDVVQYVRGPGQLETAGKVIATESTKSPASSWLSRKTGKQQGNLSERADGHQNSSLSRTEKSLWSLAGILTLILIVAGVYIFKQQQTLLTAIPHASGEKPDIHDTAAKSSHDGADDHKNLNSHEIQPQKPVLSTEVEQATPKQDAKRISVYLSKANHALKDFRLVDPKENSAEYYYRQALNIDPQNKDAINGFKKIADIYADLTEGELNRFNYTQANRFIHKGLRIQPDNKRLLTLMEHSDAFSDAPKRALDKIKSIFK